MRVVPRRRKTSCYVRTCIIRIHMERQLLNHVREPLLEICRARFVCAKYGDLHVSFVLNTHGGVPLVGVLTIHGVFGVIFHLLFIHRCVR